MDAKFQAFIDICRRNYVYLGGEEKTEREKESEDVMETRWKAFYARGSLERVNRRKSLLVEISLEIVIYISVNSR